MSATRQVYLGFKCVHEGCEKSFESRKWYNVQAEKLWHAMRDIQFGCQCISRGSADAERPKPHLQPIVDAAHQGVHHRDLQKQELLIIVKIKEKCEIFVNYSTFCSKTFWRKHCEKHAKSIAFCRFLTVLALPVMHLSG